MIAEANTKKVTRAARITFGVIGLLVVLYSTLEYTLWIWRLDEVNVGASIGIYAVLILLAWISFAFLRFRARK